MEKAGRGADEGVLKHTATCEVRPEQSQPECDCSKEGEKIGDSIALMIVALEDRRSIAKSRFREDSVVSTIALQNKLHCNKITLQRTGG